MDLVDLVDLVEKSIARKLWGHTTYFKEASPTSGAL